ncbi:helix-turn-helix domain-containing protein [Leucobacter allii]|uniref:Helix-turn-helix domain-containing protein n=1 Tax=Leucobacter allii TaxID=2932247 RepID=A0ABY4FJ48_9MICO|nr:PucR family transcriptional regulator [Leucobacter allii]UOQ56721.1 helix-turn-helix domain-containing protein [Leucobacter allii]
MNAAISTIPSRRAGGPSLEALVAALGPAVVTPIAPLAPLLAAGAAAPARVELHDVRDPLPDLPGAILLVPSAGRTAEIAALATAAGARGAAGIVLKCGAEELPELAGLARSSGVPLLRLADALGWRAADALISTWLESRGPGGAERPPRGAGALFALADELAACFGGSVAVEDLDRRVIAYSALPGQLIDAVRMEGILARAVPDSPANDDQYRTVLRASGPVRFPPVDGEEARIAQAIRSGSLPLGTIWIVDPSADAPLARAQRERLAAAAGVAAARLLEELRAGGPAERQREERLRSLLDGTAVAGSELAELGLAEDRGAELLVFDAAPGAAEAELAQLRGAVQRQLALHHPEVAATVRAGRVHALLSADPPLEDRLAALLPLLDRLLAPGVRVAVPGVARRPGDVAALAELGGRILRVAPRGGAQGAPRILTAASTRPRLVLDGVAALFAEHAELRDPAVERLLAEDPALAGTIASWCANLGNIARTARELGVHENTVRYRMRQAGERHGVALRDADGLLTTWLQLRAAEEGRSRR